MLNSYLLEPLCATTLSYFSLEQLIRYAQEADVQPSAERDPYNTVNKIIVEHLALLKNHKVRIISEQTDEPYQVLDRTIGEQQREKAVLLKNRKLKEEHQALHLADPQEAFEAHCIDQVIALDKELNRINMLLVQVWLPPPSTGKIGVYLKSCGLTRLPWQLVDRLLNGFPMLTELEISQNHLTSIPDEIGNLTTLKRFSAEGNPLTTLPTTFNNMKNLTRFDVPPRALIPAFEALCVSSRTNHSVPTSENNSRTPTSVSRASTLTLKL